MMCWMRGMLVLVASAVAGCPPSEPNRLDAMNQADVQIKDHKFRVWVAEDDDQRERGFMHVTAEQMAPLDDGTERGMLFVFPKQQGRRNAFWMKNTRIPLDIAFIAADGTIVSIRTMAPLDTRGYVSKKPYRFALEVRANLFSKLKIASGDKVRIPQSLLKQAE